MIKFFRRIRQRLLSENKFSKYLLYAIGEIVLVVIGILIALQINNWNQEKENNRLKSFYMKSLVNDLSNDTIDINRVVHIQIADTITTTEFLKRVLDPKATLDTIVNIARYEFNYPFKVKRDYADNTFQTLISTGNIELLDKDVIELLMDLKSLQSDQLERFYSHIDLYQNTMANYVRNHPVYSVVPENSIVNSILWGDINKKEFVGGFISILETRKFMFRNSVIGHLRVKEKSIEIIESINELLN